MTGLVDKGNRWVCIVDDNEGCANCYYYGTDCSNCQKDPDVKRRIMTYDEFKASSHMGISSSVHYNKFKTMTEEDFTASFWKNTSPAFKGNESDIE